MKFLFFFFLLQFLILKIQSENSITLYLGLDSEIKNITVDGKEFKITSYSKNELLDIYLIKKFSITLETNITIESSSSNPSLAAFIIDNDSNEIYLSSSFEEEGNWGCENGELTFLTLVRDYIWNNNKNIPPLASVIKCSTGIFSFKI